MLKYFNDATKLLMNSESIRSVETMENPNKTIENPYLKNDSTPCDMLVVVLNDMLKKRKGEKDYTAASELEFEKQISDCINLFNYFYSKDLFIEKYRDAFSKRLLVSTKSTSGASGSVAIFEEKIILSKIKILQGVEFTSPLERMLGDIEITEDSNKKYHKDTENSLKDQFNCTVLTGGAAWKLVKQPECILPKNTMDEWKNRYIAWYKNHTGNTGKKLTWIYSAGEVSVLAKYATNNRPYEYLLNPLQAIVLHVFNDHPNECISFNMLIEATNIKNVENKQNVEMMKRVLHSLACQPKFKLLKKTPCVTGNGIDHKNKVLEDDNFEVNTAVSFKLNKVS